MRGISYRLITLVITAGAFYLGVATPAAAEPGSERDLTVGVPAPVAENLPLASASNSIEPEALDAVEDQGKLHASPFSKHRTFLIGCGGANP